MIKSIVLSSTDVKRLDTSKHKYPYFSVTRFFRYCLSDDKIVNKYIKEDKKNDMGKTRVRQLLET